MKQTEQELQTELQEMEKLKLTHKNRISKPKFMHFTKRCCFNQHTISK